MSLSVALSVLVAVIILVVVCWLRWRYVKRTLDYSDWWYGP